MVHNLEKKPLVAIVTASRYSKLWRSLPESSIQLKLLPSINRTITTAEVIKWRIGLYIAIDEDDIEWQRYFHRDPNLQNLSFVPYWLEISVVSFPKVTAHQNRIPFNKIANVAFNDGAQYFVRINDDTEFVTSNWITRATTSLRMLEPPNVGVVGPICHQGNKQIMTHDMVHRNHMIIFNGSYYPDTFSNWWLDDWITRVYQPNRSIQMNEWEVIHHLTPSRYKTDHGEKKNLDPMVMKGRKKIVMFINGTTPDTSNISSPI